MARKPPTKSVRKFCLKCEKDKPIGRHFYVSNSDNHTDSRYPICKDCLKSNLKLGNPSSQEAIDSVKNVLLDMNRPFIYQIYIISIEEATKKPNNDIFGVYLKNVNMPQYRNYTWKDSEFEWVANEENVSTEESIEIIQDKENIKILDNRDKKDVVRMLGYDPFEYESENDKRYLYSKLIDFLDEGTMEDGFKLQAVIEIVTGFNQIDKINQAITNITNDINKLSDKSGGIQSLITAKKNILSSLLGLAKDNGISVNNNNNRSKGGNTLNGIVKKLNEIGLDAAEINLYDLETSEAMKQIADFSNKSILDQLMLDENEYTDMIAQQNEMIRNLDAKLIKVDEDNRLLKIKIRELTKQLNDKDE